MYIGSLINYGTLDILSSNEHKTHNVQVQQYETVMWIRDF